MKNHVLPVSFLIMTGLAVSCINERPNLSGHIEMDRDTLLIEVSSILGQYKGYIDTGFGVICLLRPEAEKRIRNDYDVPHTNTIPAGRQDDSIRQRERT